MLRTTLNFLCIFLLVSFFFSFSWRFASKIDGRAIQNFLDFRNNWFQSTRDDSEFITALGMASALETLCGQSYGAKQYHMLGIFLQRSWIILFTCSIIMLPIFLFTTPLFKLLGQEESIAEMAGTISLWFIPVMFSYILSFTLQMYLQAQSKNIIITYLAVITVALHFFLSWFMTMKLDLGLSGVMCSMILAMWIPVLGELVFVFFGGCPETWTGFSYAAFKDLWAIIKLSLSSGLMICLELWYNTILVLLTGYMENAEVALDALSICLNINGWEMMISIGFLSAAGYLHSSNILFILISIVGLIWSLFAHLIILTTRRKPAHCAGTE